MKILLTGAAGFIGSHILDEGLSRGIDISPVKRTDASKPVIPIQQNARWITANIEHIDITLLAGHDCLIHMAAHSTNPPYDTLERCINKNLNATLRLFEKAKDAGIKHFVVAGSCFEYGRSAERYEAVPTSACLEPTNAYAVSKAAASMALMQWAKENYLNLNLLRVFQVYGEGELPTRLWPSLKRNANEGKDFELTPAQQIRDFMNVRAVALTFLSHAFGMTNKDREVNIYNLTSGTPRSVKTFAEYWWEKWGAKGDLIFNKHPYRQGEVMRYFAGENSINVNHHIFKEFKAGSDQPQ
jgi:nucleoside-diphosphate-sugar epimerase